MDKTITQSLQDIYWNYILFQMFLRALLHSSQQRCSYKCSKCFVQNAKNNVHVIRHFINAYDIVNMLIAPCSTSISSIAVAALIQNKPITKTSIVILLHLALFHSFTTGRSYPFILEDHVWRNSFWTTPR